MCIGKRQAPIITSFHMMRSLSIWCLYTPSRWRMSFNHSPLYLKNLGPAIEYFFPDSSFASAVKDMTSPLYLTLRSSTTSAVMSGFSQYSISSPTGIWHLLNENWMLVQYFRYRFPGRFPPQPCPPPIQWPDAVCQCSRGFLLWPQG